MGRKIWDRRLSYTILLIEDDPDIQLMLTTIFAKTWAFRVVATADNGLKGFEIAQRMQQKPDVILLDFLMPVMAGPEAAKLIHGCCPDSRIYILTVVPGRCEEIPERSGCIDKSMLPSELVWHLWNLLNPDREISQEDLVKESDGI